MTTAERVEVELATIKAFEERKGFLFDDQKARQAALMDVRDWMLADKIEAERIELEAMEAEEQERLEREANDPNRKTRELFAGVKIKVPERGYAKR